MSDFGKRLAAGCGAVALVLLHTSPAVALPAPRGDQWWFTAWEIESKVWPLTRGKGVTVAVIDSGVEARLPELRGVVLKGKKIGLGEGDGRTDEDQEKGGHGTSMAVSIAGQGGGGSGLVGVAPEARILPINEVSYDYAEPIRYAADHGAKVINISIASEALRCPDATQKAVKYAIERDVVVVAAAGNEPGMTTAHYYPANCAGVLAVGALDSAMNVWTKSTPGPNVMIAAPGVNIGAVGKAGIYRKRNGTSQAAAFTSGVVALLRARFPQMSGKLVVQRLLYTTKDLDPRGWDKYSGHGALIPYTALTADVPPNAPNPVYAKIPPTRSTAPSVRNQNPSQARPAKVRNSSPSAFMWLGVAASSAAVAALAIGVVKRKRRGRSI